MRESSSRSRGSILVLALVLLTLVLLGMGVVFFLVREERHATANLVKSIRATAVAEGLCAFIVSTVNSRPWDQRFYLRDAKTKVIGIDGEMPRVQYNFTDADKTFQELLEEEDRERVEFSGVIKDIDALSKRYRIWLEVVYLGHKMTFTFDKKFSEDLLGALNHDPTVLSTSMAADMKNLQNLDDPRTDLDRALDGIRGEARKPQKLTSRNDLYDWLAKLFRQEPLRNFRPKAGMDIF